MRILPEFRCEADITYTTIQNPVTRKVDTWDGRTVDHGTDTVEKPGIEKGCINCGRCGLENVIFQVEAPGPYGAHNGIRGKAGKIVEEKCVRFASLKDSGRIKSMFDLTMSGAKAEFHPKLSS